jgi:hypothetical protein
MLHAASDHLWHMPCSRCGCNQCGPSFLPALVPIYVCVHVVCVCVQGTFCHEVMKGVV